MECCILNKLMFIFVVKRVKIRSYIAKMVALHRDDLLLRRDM